MHLIPTRWNATPSFLILHFRVVTSLMNKLIMVVSLRCSKDGLHWLYKTASHKNNGVRTVWLSHLTDPIMDSSMRTTRVKIDNLPAESRQDRELKNIHHDSCIYQPENQSSHLMNQPISALSGVSIKDSTKQHQNPQFYRRQKPNVEDYPFSKLGQRKTANVLKWERKGRKKKSLWV